MKLFIFTCVMAAVVLAQGPSKRMIKNGDHQLNRDNPFGINPRQVHYPTIPKTAIKNPKVITRGEPVPLDNVDETGVWEGAFDYKIILKNAFVLDITDYTVLSDDTDQTTGVNIVVLAYDKLTVYGDYFENSTLLYIIPVFGEGAFNVDGLDARATAVRSSPASPYVVTLWIREYVADLDNFVGGGVMETVTKGLQPIFGANIYNHLVGNIESLIGSMLDSAAPKKPVDIKSLIRSEISKMPLPKDIKETGNANDYMDQILAAVRALILENNLDPYVIAETEFLGIYIAGELFGLSTLHRAGDATFTYEKGVYTIDCTVGIYDMTAEVTWSTEILFINYDGDASLSLDVFEMHLKASAQIRNETQDFLTLNELEITATTGVNIEVHVLPVLNWIIEMVATPIVKFFDGLLTSIVENILTGIFESVLASMPIPGSQNQ